MQREQKWLNSDFQDNFTKSKIFLVCLKISLKKYWIRRTNLVLTFIDKLNFEPLYYVTMCPIFDSSEFLHLKKH